MKEDEAVFELTTWDLYLQSLPLVSRRHPSTWVGALALLALVLRMGVRKIGESDWREVRRGGGEVSVMEGRMAFLQETRVFIGGMQTYAGTLSHSKHRGDRWLAETLRKASLPMYQKATQRALEIITWAVNQERKQILQKAAGA